MVAYFKSKTLAKLITVSLFLVVFYLVALGIYFFFVSGFNFLNKDEYLRLPITLYFYELFVLALGGIFIFSALVTGIFALFRTSDESWLMSSPAYRYLPKLVLIDNSINGLWPLLVAFLPMVLALYRVNRLSFYGAVLIILSFILFLITLSALALLMILLFGYLWHYLDQKLKFIHLTLGRLVILLLIIIIIGSVAVWHNSINTDLFKLFKANSADNTAIDLKTVSASFSYLPSHPLAMSVFAWQNHNSTEAIKYFLILLVLAIIVVAAWWLASVLFLSVWQALQEGQPTPAVASKTNQIKKRSFSFSGGPVCALFSKEALVAARNSKAMLWFGFVLFIWLMQASINVVLSYNLKQYQVNPVLSSAITQVLQFVTASYFICAFVLRFVFPAFSMESKTTWILASAPLNHKKIFWAKYAFYSLVFVVIGLLLGYLNLLALPIPLSYSGTMLLLFVITILFITALGLSLGALFPNWQTDDPSIISTTMPGLAFIVLSLAYGALGGYLIYYSLGQNTFLLLYIFIISSLIATVLLITATPSLTKNKDLTRTTIS